jgi:hypothetical protein
MGCRLATVDYLQFNSRSKADPAARRGLDESSLIRLGHYLFGRRREWRIAGLAVF